VGLKDIDWAGVGRRVAGQAPLVGSLLFGRAGEAVGGLIASTLGVEPSPSAVDQALSDNPEALQAIARLEAEHREQLTRMGLEAETARLAEINRTMRAEANSEHWPQFSWRPYWGFSSGTAFIVVTVFVCVLAYEAVMGGKPESMAMIPQLIGAMAALFAIPGTILGVTAWHRGQMQRARAMGRVD
jgi:hypothetical protein